MINRRVLIAGAGATVTFASPSIARASSTGTLLHMKPANTPPMAGKAGALIDDFSLPGAHASNGNVWRYVADGVMGGLSEGRMQVEEIEGRKALRMTGEVSLANNGGFIQLSLDLSRAGIELDASGFSGIEIDTYGNGETYGLHVRTPDLTRPWQSYRQSFTAGPDWQTHRLPFSSFEPHRSSAPLDISRLRRLGLLAIGRAFEADVAIGGLRFYH